jgi:hypothetical protein
MYGPCVFSRKMGGKREQDKNQNGGVCSSTLP